VAHVRDGEQLGARDLMTAARALQSGSGGTLSDAVDEHRTGRRRRLERSSSCEVYLVQRQMTSTA
jgi:hypothetical protein